ncbi:hypothetical protein [Rhodoblastus sp.]|uniref:hypothetical protein n=1 Tax=Rhodoblastus sp. TaxID=1962975 RepID=UPI002639FC84|nr:hypothetical protein [Rhodoblastus sp.]
MTTKNPGAWVSAEAVVVQNMRNDNTVPSLAAQVISRKFRIRPAFAALVAELAGIGPKEMRS